MVSLARQGNKHSGGR